MNYEPLNEEQFLRLETELKSIQRDDALTWLIVERGALLRR